MQDSVCVLDQKDLVRVLLVFELRIISAPVCHNLCWSRIQMDGSCSAVHDLVAVREMQSLTALIVLRLYGLYQTSSIRHLSVFDTKYNQVEKAFDGFPHKREDSFRPCFGLYTSEK